MAFNPDGVFDALKKALAERMLNAEMDQHLDGETADGRANARNGYGQKMILTDTVGWPWIFRGIAKAHLTRS